MLELITSAPTTFILSNNYTIVRSHDISCVCMHPPALPLLHLTGGATECAIVAGIKKSGNSRKVPDFKGFSACMLYHVIVSNPCTRFPHSEAIWYKYSLRKGCTQHAAWCSNRKTIVCTGRKGAPLPEKEEALAVIMSANWYLFLWFLVKHTG